MIEKDIEVTNALGIHARPSSLITTTAIKFKSKIQLLKIGTSSIADAKSIMSVLMLGAQLYTKLKLIVEGSDEVEASKSIENLFLTGFNESYK